MVSTSIPQYIAEDVANRGQPSSTFAVVLMVRIERPEGRNCTAGVCVHDSSASS